MLVSLYGYIGFIVVGIGFVVVYTVIVVYADLNVTQIKFIKNVLKWYSSIFQMVAEFKYKGN